MTCLCPKHNIEMMISEKIMGDNYYVFSPTANNRN